MVSWLKCMISVIILLACSRFVISAIECSTVNSLIGYCAGFIINGNPTPSPGTPCCTAVVSMNNLSDSPDNRRSVCRCLISLVSDYHPNVTSMIRLPDLCGVSMGFTIEPYTDCSRIS